MEIKTNGMGVAFIVVLWCMGVVIAKGAWQTLFSWFPPYGIYLAVEKLMTMAGIVP
jgi:hypothetical protein